MIELRSRLRRKRVLIPVATIAGLVAAAVILRSTDLIVPVLARPGASNVPTIPPCNGRYLAEGFTYHFRDPHRGELVVIHARVNPGCVITPDPHARDLNLTKRVIGVPGDTVVGRNERVFVNGRKADDIPTAPRPSSRPISDPSSTSYSATTAANRRTAATSGQYHAAAIFGRVFLIYWPLGRVGTPGYDKHLRPPGRVAC